MGDEMVVVGGGSEWDWDWGGNNKMVGSDVHVIFRIRNAAGCQIVNCSSIPGDNPNLNAIGL